MRKRWRGGAADVAGSSEEKLGSITAALPYRARLPAGPYGRS